MATVKAIVRTTRKGVEVNIRFRLSDGRGVQLYHNSEITVKPELWDLRMDCVKKRAVCPEVMRIKVNKDVNDRKCLMMELYRLHKDELMNGLDFDRLIDRHLHPERHKPAAAALFDLMCRYIESGNRSDSTNKADRDTMAVLRRYEAFQRLTENSEYRLTIESFNADLLEDIRTFYMNEGSLYAEYPLVFRQLQSMCGLSRTIRDKGENVTYSTMKRLKAFFAWCVRENFIDRSPFEKFTAKMSQVYGTPYYLTLEERNLIADHDFSNNKRLDAIRDVFIFQCHIGCRVSDLIRLKASNIIEDAVEYIPQKTGGERPQRVRVPLSERAKNLVGKYAGVANTLLPVPSIAAYNRGIKEVLTACGITRAVTILDPLTRREKQKPINEIASSHMARRTFIGNLYKKVKDPNIVGALSGHSEGSKAFARYREIDEEIRREVISLIN